MSRKPVPPGQRKVHLLGADREHTVCGRDLNDPAVLGYLTTQPPEATCGACTRKAE